MRDIFKIQFVLLIAMAALYPAYNAIADDDYIQARKLQEQGDILPLEFILKQVRDLYPGKVLEVELDQEGGKIFYEIEILAKNGIVKEIYIDAKTGDLVRVKEDD